MGEWAPAADDAHDRPPLEPVTDAGAQAPSLPGTESVTPGFQVEPAPAHAMEAFERALAGHESVSAEVAHAPVSLDSILASLELRAAEARSRIVDAPSELLLPESLALPEDMVEPVRERLGASAREPVPEPEPMAPPQVQASPEAVAVSAIETAPAAMLVPVPDPARIPEPVPVRAPAPESFREQPLVARPVAIAHEIPALPMLLPQSSTHARATTQAETPRDYAMVAPVELQFDDDGPRVGIRSGTRTYLEFQRIAGVLWGDLKRSKSAR